MLIYEGHGFKPWYVNSSDIDSFSIVDFYGSAKTFTVQEYLDADPLQKAPDDDVSV